jgi:hypothetical protein
MKRLIAAVSFSLLAVPALAEIGLPYDQNLVDRQLPNIEFPAVEANVADERAPFDQLTIDRALPNLQVERTQVAETASAGNTRSDAEISTDEAPAAQAPTGSGLATGPWANDYHFIAPAQ